MTKLNLYKIGKRYSFKVDNFSSLNHFFLIPGIKYSYKYAWQAYKDAKNLALKQSYHINALNKLGTEDTGMEDLTKEDAEEVSAEEMIISHYNELFNILSEKSNGTNKEDELDIIYNEIKDVVSAILKILEQIEDHKTKTSLNEIISKFRKLVKSKFSDKLKKDVEEENKLPPIPDIPDSDQTMPQQPISKASKSDTKITTSEDKNIELDVIEGYAHDICMAIEKKHPSAIYKIDKDKSVIIYDAETNKSILRVGFNNKININKIIPLGDTAEIYPCHSIEFYQRYWKPIVEKTGHYYIDETRSLIVSDKTYLPDVPDENKSFYIKTFNTNNIKTSDIKRVLLKFAISPNSPIWDLKSEPNKIDDAEPKDAALETPIAKKPSSYTEEDFKEDTLVECITPELTSIFGKRGTIVQVIPTGSHIELDVKFLDKNLGIKRLTTDQIKIHDI